MWIAKPITALRESERELWNRVPSKPLAQTWAWAQAARALGTETYLAFSPAESVGGILHALPDPSGQGLRFECTNGPLLHWSSATDAPRQLATFAVAASKLSPHFKSLVLRPRWGQAEAQAWAKMLPLQPNRWDHAATLTLKPLTDPIAQLAGLSDRLKRTLKTTRAAEAQAEWLPLTRDSLAPFLTGLVEFSSRAEFTLPPAAWFEALLAHATDSGLSLHLGRARLPDGSARSEVLVVGTASLGRQGATATYLYGFEQRTDAARAAHSVAAFNQFNTLLALGREGVKTYDLGGYIVNVPPDHPYAGVCAFKDQFNGETVAYSVPEFVIS